MFISFRNQYVLAPVSNQEVFGIVSLRKCVQLIFCVCTVLSLVTWVRGLFSSHHSLRASSFLQDSPESLLGPWNNEATTQVTRNSTAGRCLRCTAFSGASLMGLRNQPLASFHQKYRLRNKEKKNKTKTKRHKQTTSLSPAVWNVKCILPKSRVAFERKGWHRGGWTIQRVSSALLWFMLRSLIDCHSKSSHPHTHSVVSA